MNPSIQPPSGVPALDTGLECPHVVYHLGNAGITRAWHRKYPTLTYCDVWQYEPNEGWRRINRNLPIPENIREIFPKSGQF